MIAPKLRWWQIDRLVEVVMFNPHAGDAFLAEYLNVLGLPIVHDEQ